MRFIIALLLMTARAEAGPVQTLADLPAADVVVLGETHDNPEHHRLQAQAVANLVPKALVFEMLTPEAAARLPVNRTDRATVELALGWADSGWPDFAMYHPIFLAAPQAQVFGADVSQTDLVTAMKQGTATAFGDDAALYGLDQPLDAVDQTEREAEQAAAHCYALPVDLMPGMVAAQRLRDAALARAVVQALAATGGPVAVMTGNGHARRDSGFPAILTLMSSASLLSVGLLEQDPGPNAPFDLWIVTPPQPREDPCLAFGAQSG